MDSSPPSKTKDSCRKVRTRANRPVSAGSTSSTGSGDLPPLPLSFPIAVFNVVMDQKSSYGMKVSGDRPVYVQSVKPGGSADRAGLKAGDKILKVNGKAVSDLTHMEVVEMIKSDAQVALTVQQQPLHRPPMVPSSPPGIGVAAKRKGNNSRENITGPQPVDLEERKKYESSRRKTFHLMMENEQRNIEALRSKLVVTNDAKTLDELGKAENRLKTIQNQLLSLIGPLELHHNNSASSGLSPPPFPPSRPRPPFSTSPSTPPALPPRNPPAHMIAACDNNGFAANNHLSTPTHQRTKSSPETLGMSSPDDGRHSSLMISSESVLNLSKREDTSSSSNWDIASPRITPPGTPPPPYGNTSGEITLHGTDFNGVGHLDASYSGPIISMEDDDMSDQEMSQLEDHGPFKSVNKLLGHPAHLSVFMNFVLSSSDPSSLLFYLLTDLYKEGNVKEMKKWAYEIHSTFLVPDAPLRLPHVDEINAREVDEVLLNESDREEILRKIFWKPRAKAKESLSTQLTEYRQKRVAGLGALFGATDIELEESINDKAKELTIIEGRIMPHIETILPTVEGELYGRNEDEVRAYQRKSSICSSLCTLASKLFGLRSANPLIERVPSFVCKDKTSKLKLLARNQRKVTVHGHTLHAHHFFTVTHCNCCGRIIGGVSPQGYQCTSCLLNIHRWCVRPLEEECPGPLKKDKPNDRISKLMDRIRPEREARRKPSNLHLDKIKKPSEERDEFGNSFTDGDGEARRADLSGSSDMAELNVAAADTASGSGGTPHSGGGLPGDRKPSSTSINRSESYKERVQRRQLREKRKTSDPNLSSKSTNNDTADVDALQLNNNSGSSSTSTHSLNPDSPSASMEVVTGNCAPGTDFLENWDSDIEIEADPPDWTQNVDEQELRQLSSREKKRQGVINELFHTERSHVRALKVLERIFYRPLSENQILPQEQLVLLFPNLGEMLDIHSNLNSAMKLKRKESPIVGNISELLLNTFDGDEGKRFKGAAATFCAKHQLALEALKEKRRKDQKLNNFLNESEGNPVCRRLQLKDIVPFGFQRLTKYPLLFENLLKLSDESEFPSLQLVLERSKDILNHVNAAVKEAADYHRLNDIQRRLDKGPFDKIDHLSANEFKNLDITKHRLVHEGLLSWRQNKNQKLMDLHVVLLEDLIMLLVKQDEKFVLKFFPVNTGTSTDKPLMYSPIIRTSTVLLRPVATDKRAFFLVNISQACSQIFELVALSNAERKSWSKHITDTADAARLKNKPRQDANPPPAFPVDTPVPEEPKTVISESTVTLSTENAASEGALLSPQEPDSPSANLSSEEKPFGGVVRRTSSAASTAANRDSKPRVVQENALIQPSEVRVCQNQVLVAEPVFTPIELLRREDETIMAAIRRKQQIVANLLHIPQDQFENIAELAGETGTTCEKEQTELALACFHHVTRLTTMLNESLRITEEDSITASASSASARYPPTVNLHFVQEVSSALSSHITELLKMTKERDAEREMIRKENMRLREQIHAMLEQRRGGATTSEPKRRSTSVGFSHHDGLSRDETVDQPYEEEITDDPEVTEGTEEVKQNAC